jgi:hypothetical protein
MIESCSNAPVFDFGGVAMAFSCRDERFMSLVRQRYGAFSTQQPPALRISYLVDGERAPHPRAIHAARQHPLGACRHGKHYTLDGGTFRGEWDRAAGKVEIRGPLATYPVDRLIEAMVYAVNDRVVILHATALVFAGRGFICSGPSGSGKSTLAGLFPDNALCDEHVAVRLDGQADLLSSLPFWRGRRGTTPLEAIYLLEHATKNRRRRLSACDAASRLRPQVIWPAFGRDNLRKAFETFYDVIERVPVWELGFRPEIAVRRVLTGEAGE